MRWSRAVSCQLVKIAVTARSMELWTADGPPPRPPIVAHRLPTLPAGAVVVGGGA